MLYLDRQDGYAEDIAGYGFHLDYRDPEVASLVAMNVIYSTIQDYLDLHGIWIGEARRSPKHHRNLLNALMDLRLSEEQALEEIREHLS
jgi:hypothetical protein